MDQMMQEIDGKVLLPPLMRTARGWVEMDPDPCPCGGEGVLVGWTSCACRPDAFAPGHRTWQCKTCLTITRVGCTGTIDLGPMESYGCR